jgi:hypothetical protein
MSVGSALTDGTGVSSLTGSKVVKDFVADALLSGAAALVAIQVTDLGSALAQPQVVAFALAGALIRVAYRAVLKWATT